LSVLLKHETDLQKVRRRMQVSGKGVEVSGRGMEDDDDELRRYR
jgi:hypothetical protein